MNAKIVPFHHNAPRIDSTYLLQRRAAKTWVEMDTFSTHNGLRFCNLSDRVFLEICHDARGTVWHSDDCAFERPQHCEGSPDVLRAKLVLWNIHLVLIEVCP